MGKVSITLHLFFEDPYWVGVFELGYETTLTVCKAVFGSEPKDYEVYAYVNALFDHLQFSPSVSLLRKEKSKSPKRVQKEVRKQIRNIGVSTKSLQAMKLKQEQEHILRKEFTRKAKKEKKNQVYAIKKQKRKKKHKGR